MCMHVTIKILFYISHKQKYTISNELNHLLDVLSWGKWSIQSGSVGFACTLVKKYNFNIEIFGDVIETDERYEEYYTNGKIYNNPYYHSSIAYCDPLPTNDCAIIVDDEAWRYNKIN